MSSNPYQVCAVSDKARVGIFQTAHGTFETPQFMPVGTRASVKGIDVERLKECGTQITLVNTYHLWLRPGADIIEQLGGVLRFCGWPGPILSDIGGFQVFSMKSIRQITEEGVEFRSHLDGSLQFLSPEVSIAIQQKLGVDIAMAFDECPAADLDYQSVEKSLAMTLRWAKRSLAARTRSETRLFGITQGGIFRDLRSRAAAELCALPFDGFAIGGLSVGESKQHMYEVLSYHVDQLAPERIRYLMGVGTPEDIVQAVSEGVDLFDCVMPTRAGRFGRGFVRGPEPFVNIKNLRFAVDPEPLDRGCHCLACRRYSRAYLHHLFKVGEMLGPQLLSIHNVTHYLDLMTRIRAAIRENRFSALHQEERRRWKEASKQDGIE